MKHFGLMTPRSLIAGTTPPLLDLLSGGGAGGTNYTSPTISPVADALLLVINSYRRTTASAAVPAQSTINNSGTLLTWTVENDVFLAGLNPGPIRQTLFAAVAPNPARDLIITITSANQAQGHVCILQLRNGLANFANVGYDTDPAGDMVLALPTASLANSLSLMCSAAAQADGASASVFGAPAGWTGLYNGFKKAVSDGNNPISQWVGYRQHFDAYSFTTAGLNTVGSLTELKHA